MAYRYLFTILFLFSSSISFSQQFFHTGSTEDVETEPVFGILLAGGASDNDDGMKWLAQRANGGDVVVLRASGSDGYNNYIYNQLGVEVNSVTSIVIIGSSQANNPDVCEAVDNAEMVFIAGGNQWHYYNEWKGTCLQEALNRHVNEKNAPIGGTSAGLAVLGEIVYTAENGTVTADQALANPYHNRVTLERDFLQVPFMQDIVTDSHYDERDRQGRHTVFLARMVKDWQLDAKGIGVDEYTAVGVDENGIARVFGETAYDDNAYFLRANSMPEVCEQGEPLTWYNDQTAVMVYKIKGDPEGTITFDLNNWEEGEGGEWWAWYTENGEFYQIPAATVSTVESENSHNIRLYPNPASQHLWVETLSHDPLKSYRIFDTAGRKLAHEKTANTGRIQIDLTTLHPGTYLFLMEFENNRKLYKFVKQ